eukprot:TRINITY_DN13892_c0_g2_i1.p1 TRINITY_DN13892_c0_g2~~TRINITY_DN13892_c0_g2_i1.p1  ORF type:complete len:394 (-),score=83.38 TRINITY_DN13892_c0_g2_i1:31-1143(-)
MSSEVTDNKVAQLLSLMEGEVSEEKARSALNRASGDLEAAVVFLFENTGSVSTGPSKPNQKSEASQASRPSRAPKERKSKRHRSSTAAEEGEPASQETLAQPASGSAAASSSAPLISERELRHLRKEASKVKTEQRAIAELEAAVRHERNEAQAYLARASRAERGKTGAEASLRQELLEAQERLTASEGRNSDKNDELIRLRVERDQEYQAMMRWQVAAEAESLKAKRSNASNVELHKHFEQVHAQLNQEVHERTAQYQSQVHANSEMHLELADSQECRKVEASAAREATASLSALREELRIASEARTVAEQARAAAEKTKEACQKRLQAATAKILAHASAENARKRQESLPPPYPAAAALCDQQSVPNG